MPLIPKMSYFRKQKASDLLYVSKNSLDSAYVLNILRQKKWLKGWTFYEIKNLTHHQVLSVMTDSLIFFLLVIPGIWFACC